MVSKELNKKIERAIKLIQSAARGGQILEVAYSGGKDSDVILQLVKESGVSYRAIYKNTTIDPPGTIAHVKAMGAEIVQPKMTFAQLMEKKGTPNRVRRFCCSYLKEYKILDKCIIGVRREESAKRAKRYTEPTQCRVYSKGERVEQILPILDWTLNDIVEFAKDRNITFAPVYYDKNGTFQPTRRLGCICCPLQSSKSRIEEFKKYPNMVKLYLNAIQKYKEAHPNSNVSKYSKYEIFVQDLFYNKRGQFQIINAVDLFGNKPDWKEFLERQFNIKL